ncbi:hypothetical protein THAOC_20042 [Thalassiosira oceanica]|uniref:Uncharacterized protein n=1 Tax=Thalassiosira oceanica TaxID=159749 RepID=K0S3E4_THAOC|nr:hypothetical protein THAOC_20042 [Thalassiosira oceanica]|eukprot:EJK59700.1 hypothetical protein THAOC_20042 [Thalassiosira oceanica]
MNVVCEDDPSFLYKNRPGYDCAYIARELPEKCSKTHNGNLVGFVDCPVSCGMVDKCHVRVDEGEDNDNMWLDGMDDDWVWVEGSRFYEDDFAFDPFAGIHLNEEGFMQFMEDDAFEDLAFDPFTGTLEEEAKLYVDGSMREHDVEILNDDLDTEENNETYLRIKKLEDKTFVSKAVNGTDVVPGLPAKAEILDGQCAPFTNEANSTYFTDGVAAAVHAPTLTDAEKRQGNFDHTYCAGLDFVYEGKSVVQKRYLMQISYHYLVDKKSGEVQGLLGADVHDENGGVEKRNMAVAVGFGAFGGVILTLALVAMIFGKKRRQREVAEGRNMHNSSGKYPELVNAPSIEAVNEAFRVGGSLDGGDVGGEDVTDGDYEAKAIAAVGETERREWKKNELV